MEDEPVADFSVPFSLSTEYEPLRLIELPPPVLDEITKNPSAPLALKSSSSTENGTALVCTSNQTFEVRQMQSSNLLLITETRPPGDFPTASILAIAQPKGMLELSPKSTDPTAWLTASLPVAEFDAETSQTTVQKGQPQRAKAAWINVAPFSTGEFEQGWKNVCAFEWNGVAVIPSASLCVNTWKSINVAALLRGVDFKESVASGLFENAVSEDGLPEPAVVAILTRVSSHEGDGFKLNEDLLVPWVGESVLRQQTSSSINKSTFLQQWKDLLPERWRTMVDLKLIEGKFESPTASTIKFTQPGGVKAQSKKPASKWHEKLKASRQ